MSDSVFEHQVRNDDDNVHDRNVNELSKYYFKIIRESSNNEYFDKEFVKEIVDYLENSSSLSLMKKKIVIDYLNYINNKKPFIVNFECDELEFLFFVWNRIKSPINKHNMEKLINNLFLMILDCYEEDSDFIGYRVKRLVCTSGRVMKILSAFTCIDSDIGLFLSSDILKKEFLDKIALYYGENTDRRYYEEIIDEIIDEYNPIYRKQLESFKKEIMDILVFCE